jgi:diacylglycerol kinase family enzyme
VQVIATTISGSIADWGKVERIVPLFRQLGCESVELQVVDSHAEARTRTRDLVAGGSGTFNSVLEGCIDTGVGLQEVRIGFLRKGSADLIGKVLDMPDDIETAVGVFVDSLQSGHTVPCDVIRAETAGDTPARHFVGYGGAAIFGRVPHFTENRLTRYYKGLLSQLFGDLGPFFVGASLAALDQTLRHLVGRARHWTIAVDGEPRSSGRFQSIIIVNGDLGKDLPFARDVPLGSGDFHVFALRDIGARRLPAQFRKAFDASIQEDPERWGFEHFRVAESLDLSQPDDAVFPINVDGSTMVCRGAARFRIVDCANLMAKP